MIPQSNPKAGYLSHREDIEAAISRVLQSGWYILGSEVAAFEVEFAKAMKAEWSIGVANGTDAIELALRALGVSHGDRVVTVSHTAVATVSAIARIGAHPLFADIDPYRYTMSADSLRAVLETPEGRSAKAVVVVHLYGQPADIPGILEAAGSLPVVEDCAQAHGAILNGRPVGTWGEMGCFSFYPTKNLGALGDGGAVIGNRSDLKEKLRLLREYGWQTRYISQDVGLNSRLDELQAAILRVKLPHLENENNRRRSIAAAYERLLSAFPLVLPPRVPESTPVFHQYVIQAPGRDALRDRLRESGVATLIHYPVPVHRQPAYSSPAFRPCSLTNTEALAARILSLPIFPELSDDDVNQVGLTLRALL